MHFFDQLKQAYIVVDQADMGSVYLNPSAQTLLQLPSASLPERLWQSTFKPVLALADKQDHANVVINRQHIDIVLSPLEFEGRAYWALHLTLSTAQQPQVDYFYSLLDNLGAYVYCKDREFKYTYVNRQVCSFLERDYDDIIGKTDSDLFGPATAKEMHEQFDNQIMLTGATVQKEERNYLPHLNEHRYFYSIKKPIYKNAKDKSQPEGLLGVSIDISEQKRLQKLNRDNEQKLSSIINNAGAFIFIKDRECRFKYVNKRTEDLFGMKMGDIVGKDSVELLGPVQGEQFIKTDREVFATSEKISCIETFESGQGTSYFWTVKVPLENEHGEIDSYIGISTDITEQKLLENNLREANDQLEQQVGEITRLKDELHLQASHDALTGLHNRGYFEQHNGRLLANEKQQFIALLVIDVDDFKQVNDTFGHPKGDEVLIFLAQCLRQICRHEDLICRFGGEEFLILFAASEVKGALNKAHRIRETFAEQARLKFAELDRALTISVGVACSSQQNLSFKALYQAADVAMYQAKNCGKNTCILAES